MKEKISILLSGIVVLTLLLTPLHAQHTESLLTLMTGSFSSENQSREDSSYYNISLHMYPIWEADTSNWLYVEQALFTMQERPYRQRVYQIRRLNDSTFASIVYTLKNEEEAIGKWKDPSFFDGLSKEILEERQGCTVFLKQLEEQIYSGQTGENTCLSNLRGASFATSVVSILSDKIESWDRGFDSEGNQVWGARKGPYIFERIEK